MNSKLQIPLSNEDIQAHLGSQQIAKYSDLKNYKDLYHLMPLKKDYKIILLEAEENRGHWVVIIRQGKKFYYVNSHGNKYDSKSYLSKMILKILKQDKNEIQRLISATGLKGIWWNRIKMQGDSQACGRFVVFMVIMSNLDYTPPQAVDFLTRHKGSKTYDQLICDLV